MRMWLYRSALGLLFLCMPWSFCTAADLLVVVSNVPVENYRDVDIAADYYGVGTEIVHVNTASDIQHALYRMRDPNLAGVIIHADALPKFSEPRVRAALRRGAAAIPLLVTGVTAKTDAAILQSWSRGALRQCTAPEQVQPGSLLLGNTRSLLHELAGLKIPVTNPPACVFVRADDSHSEIVAAYASGDSPAFVRIATGPQELFFATDLGKPDLANLNSAAEFFRSFSPLIASMVFVRYAAGESGWHAPAHYANLTIDDVWLTQPYGHLDFQSLLEEMEKHNFHATLAFIPWNFDRSEQDAIAIIREHPHRYSISIHGNNHDHTEFFRDTDDGRSTPLTDEELAARLKQAVARMEQFRMRTSISYDRFMIFPHERFPSATLRFMKRFNYVGMANENLVPIDRQQPADDAFFLHSPTTFFENFPGVRRYSAEEAAVPEYLVAIAAFLEHPLLFYAHHAYFARGANVFNATVDFINHIDPEVNWTGLGNMAQHLYKMRRRADHDFDLWTRTADFRLRNNSGREQTYYVSKDENFADPIRQVTANGQPITYSRQANRLTLILKVPPGQEQHVRIEYGNDLNLTATDVSKPNLRINALRRISDFRDLVLSRSMLGDTVVALYYGKLNVSDFPLYRVLLVCVVAGAGLLLAASYAYRHVHRKRKTARSVPTSQ
ncbi:MAG: hypothetical protein DMG13_06070 [Acidobacteria bacterium]|nr:MAG: hypothetical protein DMG13_06070 [Acidobacteriota bacterium]